MTPSLITGAEWLGKGQLIESKIEVSVSKDESCTSPSLVEIAAKEQSDVVPTSVGANVSGSDVEAAKKDKVELKPTGEDHVLELGERSYRVRGLQKNGSLEPKIVS